VLAEGVVVPVGISHAAGRRRLLWAGGTSFDLGALMAVAPAHQIEIVGPPPALPDAG
jgi:hypothetical protein